MELNKYLTPIEELGLDSKPDEVKELFEDFMSTVPFIRYLTSVGRKRACDLERDSKGRIKVDITHPHILEDMDYFRPAALFFQKNGCYTKLRPNNNPNSEFGKWILEEARRCREGYVRESDGEWVTGDYYYFLNYAPMSLVKKQNKNDRKGKRVVDFPTVWDGHYLKFHALEQARNQGKHYFELASRSKGKSFCGASLLAKRFVLGESADVNKKVVCYITADDKKYLVAGDQTLDKFLFDIDWVTQYMEWPSHRLINSLSNMQWMMGYKDVDSGVNKGTLNSVIGVTSKDDPAKLRGTRGVLYALEEIGTFAALLDLYGNIRHSVEEGEDVFGLIAGWGCCCAGTKIRTSSGDLKPIEELTQSDGVIGWDGTKTIPDTISKMISLGEKPCVRITLNDGTYIDCSIDHPIYKAVKHTSRLLSYKEGNKRAINYSYNFVPAAKLKIGDSIVQARIINGWGTETLFDARLVGMLIGDGSYGYDNTPKYSSEDKELLEYVKNRYNWGLSASHITKSGKLYEDIRVKNICKNLREIGIYGQTKSQKRLPDNYKNLTKEDTILLLSGIIDTDGCVHVSTINPDYSYIEIDLSNKEILLLIDFLMKKLGVWGSITKCKARVNCQRKDKNDWYCWKTKGYTNFRNLNCLDLLVKRKRENLLILTQSSTQRVYHYDKLNIELRKIIAMQDIGVKEIYNMEVSNTHTYLANDIITHNTAGDKDSDFNSAQEIMYNPDGYNVISFDNVYDKEGQGKKKFAYFFPAYLDRANCYDENGNSDVTKALLQVLVDRYNVKHNTTQISAITKRIAEAPITPQEAMLRSKGNMFPVTLINERLAQIDNDSGFYDDTYVGWLVQKPNGEVEFQPSKDDPIRDFPLKTNKDEGAIEIFEMPRKNNDGKVFSDRYLISHDPVDSDNAESLSLTSTLVLDMWTDKIVAEYTGRKQYADENFEIVRLMCLFYNCKCMYEQNKKGIFAYFSLKNCLHLLADTPEYLKDRQLIKATNSYGNTSKGITATLPINNYANERIREWLLKPITTTIEENGEVKEVILPNLYFIKNRALLKELAMFNPFINVDRVRSLGMLMLYREEKMVLYSGDLQHGKNVKKKEEDDFFSKNYDKKFNLTMS